MHGARYMKNKSVCLLFMFFYFCMFDCFTSQPANLTENICLIPDVTESLFHFMMWLNQLLCKDLYYNIICNTNLELCKEIHIPESKIIARQWLVEEIHSPKGYLAKKTYINDFNVDVSIKIKKLCASEI